MMKVAILFDSKTGNTRQVAEAIQNACAGEKVVAFGLPQELPEADLYFMGSWTDKGNCSEPVAKLCGGLSGRKAALFGTAGFGGSPAYFQQLGQRFQGAFPPDCIMLGVFFCQGRMPASVRARYEAMLQERPGDEKLEASLKNFDAALPPP